MISNKPYRARPFPGGMGQKIVHLAAPLPIVRGAPRTQKEAKRLPKGTSDDDADALPKFNQMFADFRIYFSSENDSKNEPEIVKKYIQIMARLFYYVL